MTNEQLAALDKARADVPQWQPIETAPKDGTWCNVGCWVTHNDGSDEWCAWAEPCDGSNPGCEGIYGTAATHWSPLPASPKEPKQ